jgi:hypothetical protein
MGREERTLLWVAGVTGVAVLAVLVVAMLVAGSSTG